MLEGLEGAKLMGVTKSLLGLATAVRGMEEGPDAVLRGAPKALLLASPPNIVKGTEEGPGAPLMGATKAQRAQLRFVLGMEEGLSAVLRDATKARETLQSYYAWLMEEGPGAVLRGARKAQWGPLSYVLGMEEG